MVRVTYLVTAHLYAANRLTLGKHRLSLGDLGGSTAFARFIFGSAAFCVGPWFWGIGRQGAKTFTR